MVSATRNSPIVSHLNNVPLESDSSEEMLHDTIEKIKNFLLKKGGIGQFFLSLANKDNETIAARALHDYIGHTLLVDPDLSGKMWEKSYYNPVAESTEDGKTISLDTRKPICDFLKEIAEKHEQEEEIEEDFWTSNIEKIEEQFRAALPYYETQE